MLRILLIQVLLGSACLGTWAEGVTRAIRFAPGASSATLQGAVIRGESDTYTFDAGADQNFWINLSSVENNATFDLYNTSNELCDSEARSAQGRLPNSGIYTIVVSPSRGNATYKLKLTIR